MSHNSGSPSGNKRYEDSHDAPQDGNYSANERQGDWSADFALDSETSRQGRSPVSTMSVANTDTSDGEDEDYLTSAIHSSTSSLGTNTPPETNGEDDEPDFNHQTLCHPPRQKTVDELDGRAPTIEALPCGGSAVVAVGATQLSDLGPLLSFAKTSL
ncbi:hypothetical protein BHE90_014216 [Fusarium euwallaceae]|uniref:Uncharacterized protein n=1 Tax=Fusarium euwallaceae TaxID=1147111 RepID=A0A430L6V1_9HYPO|nr:hypothetical protein BHE90_014216 [Fusarium euwallaceae]